MANIETVGTRQFFVSLGRIFEIMNENISVKKLRETLIDVDGEQDVNMEFVFDDKSLYAERVNKVTVFHGTEFQRPFNFRQNDAMGFVSSILDAAVDYYNSVSCTKYYDDILKVIGSDAREISGPAPQTNTTIFMNGNGGLWDGMHRTEWLYLFLTNKLPVVSEKAFGDSNRHYVDEINGSKGPEAEWFQTFLKTDFLVKYVDSVDPLYVGKLFVNINNGAKSVSTDAQILAKYPTYNTVIIKRRLDTDKKYLNENLHINGIKNLYAKTAFGSFQSAFNYIIHNMNGVNNNTTLQRERFWTFWGKDADINRFFEEVNSVADIYDIVDTFDDGAITSALSKQGHLSTALIRLLYDVATKGVAKTNEFGFKSLKSNYKSVINTYLKKNEKNLLEAIEDVKENIPAYKRVTTFKQFNYTEEILDVFKSYVK